ncbi:TraR/DksA C4-type zinc finger protein [Pseudoduganella sp. RAF53_2]|uniref:TraR/DksA C4-type zinc finger protein n=1 Tax=unclassified Pseudoduganella TaxID=2637179 RepID=UPI003F9DC1B8
MTDIADNAVQTEQEARDRALKAQQQRAGLRDKTVADSAEFCEACGDHIIPARRVAMPGVQTCLACQEEQEYALRVHTRGYP